MAAACSAERRKNRTGGSRVTRATDEISVIVKTYDFTLWLLPHLAKFNRDCRFTLYEP
jgi:hypothetical protein